MSAEPSRSQSALTAIRPELLKDAPTTIDAEISVAPEEIIAVIDSLKQEVEARRLLYIQKAIEKNKQQLYIVTLEKEKDNATTSNTDDGALLLIKRQTDAINMQNESDSSSRENDYSGSQEDTSVLGSDVLGKNSVKPIRIPEVKRLPPYTTWIFLDRNQRMPEHQSVVGRRRIYYDLSGGEALICSDSEEEIHDEEEDKKDFVRSEDYILRMAAQQVGLSDAVLDLLGQCFSKKPADIKARYEVLCGEMNVKAGLKIEDPAEISETANPYLEKDLEGALDSFDNLFCRRCYVFDCRLHGCSQDLIFPSEKQQPWVAPEVENKPCGPGCYRSVTKVKGIAETNSLQCNDSQRKPSTTSDQSSVKHKGKYTQSESASSNVRNASNSSDSGDTPGEDSNLIDESSVHPKTKLSGKSGTRKNNNKRVADRMPIQKRQKKMINQDSDSVTSGGNMPRDMKLRSRTRKKEDVESLSLRKVNASSDEQGKKDLSTVGSSKFINPDAIRNPFDVAGRDHITAILDDNSRKEERVDESPDDQETSINNSWKTLEKSLYEKGLEIFGKSSCLIARNLLNGLKTCSEVYHYMTHLDKKLLCEGDDNGISFDFNEHVGNDVVKRSRYVRRRGKLRLKYTSKSTGYHSIRKWISERKDQPCRQFNPCGCQTACGKQCSCLLNGTCCEKYCGCPKTCKNRFRGCHCAKSQCRSRQCPCFAADRECDPDVCRNCWVSCGDGTLGTPNQIGDNYECRNMKLLLKQQQRVLLGRSDVSGWGAFLKNGVAKHEYLGEYTGELISHREADKRGKIYDRENSSFLFNLNDQFVLDAFRKGDKLKFANHSPTPNCYAKVIMVAGDHRVGIFAKERINGGEELFYDYRYEPDRAPAWAKKPEAPGSKKDDAGPSNRRARKLA